MYKSLEVALFTAIKSKETWIIHKDFIGIDKTFPKKNFTKKSHHKTQEKIKIKIKWNYTKLKIQVELLENRAIYCTTIVCLFGFLSYLIPNPFLYK